MNKMKLWFLGIATAFMLFIPTVGYSATVNKVGDAIYAIPASGLNKVFVMSNTVDISAAANGDVYRVLPVGTGTVVLNVFTKIVTPNNAATSSAVDVGDGNGASSYDASVNMKAAAGTLTKGVGGTDAYITNDGTLYTTGDTIDLTFAVTGTNTAGSVKVMALCVDLN